MDESHGHTTPCFRPKFGNQTVCLHCEKGTSCGEQMSESQITYCSCGEKMRACVLGLPASHCQRCGRPIKPMTIEDLNALADKLQAIRKRNKGE